MEGGGPRLDLSGPILKRAFETLVAGTESQGGIEQWIDALKLKSRMIQQALGQGHPADLPLETFKSLCAFMASVRRRVGPYLEKPAWDDMVAALAELVDRESEIPPERRDKNDLSLQFDLETIRGEMLEETKAGMFMAEAGLLHDPTADE